MNRFNEIFEKYLNETELSMIGMDSTNEGYVELNPIIMENFVLEAINENEFPELAPVPKPVLNFICSKIKTRNISKFEISYKEIFELLKNYNYKDLYDFKQTLKILQVFDSGYLCIGVCPYEFKEFLKLFESNEMDLNRIKLFFQQSADSQSGNTFSGDPILKAHFKNACIWLNKDFIIPNSTWKDTLSHELTHFIHRIVIFQRTSFTGKIEKNIINEPNSWYTRISLDENTEQKFSDIFGNLLKNYNPIVLTKLISLFKGTLYSREEATVVQNIMNGFQRMYEQQNMVDGKPNYKNFEINHISENYKDKREEFLKNLLNTINDPDFFNTAYGKNVINHLMNFNNQKIKSIYAYQKEFKEAIYILQYLCIKNIMPEWRIDEKLKRHFEIFKFRDN